MLFPAAAGLAVEERACMARSLAIGALLFLMFLAAQVFIIRPSLPHGVLLTNNNAAPMLDATEKIVHGLSTSNARLQRENVILMEQVVQLRRMLRGCHCSQKGLPVDNTGNSMLHVAAVPRQTSAQHRSPQQHNSQQQGKRGLESHHV